MTTNSSAGRRPVYFCYANPTGFSGQKAATEILLKGLSARGWICRRLPQPVYERSGGRTALLHYLLGVLAAWMSAARLLVARGGWLCVNLGQTRIAFLRDGVPLLLGRAGLGRARVAISLHGSLFMHWTDASPESRVFQFLLGNAGTITVLGERQRARLLALGFPEDRVKVVVNSCDLAPSSSGEVAAKHSAAADPGRAVRCLHLSSLIDTKGFPEYLEALLRMSAAAGRCVEAVLCGRLVATEDGRRFRDLSAAEEWIEQKLQDINRSSRVKVRWIKGAAGADKAALFREADLFVMPTRYAVEAQPLVLLEAMAAGCAIITTPVGEIPTILDARSALFLASASTDEVTSALETMVADAPARARLAQAAYARFMDCYQVERHLDEWEILLNPAQVPATNAA